MNPIVIVGTVRKEATAVRFEEDESDGARWSQLGTMMTVEQMMARFALIAALLAVVAACGPARESGRKAGGSSVVVTRRALADVTTRIVGATPKQREILVDALAGIGDTKIDVIEVAPAEKGWVDDHDAVGLGFSAGNGELDMRTEWESWLVGQALAVRSSELGLPVIAYLGGRGAGQSSVGKASPRAPRVAATDSEIKVAVHRIDAAARDAKAKVDEIRILKPLGLAVAITVRVSDPAQFLDKRVEEFLRALGGQPMPGARDYYLRFVDGNGARIMEIAGAEVGEGSSGASWVRPDLAGCYDPAMSRPTGWEPPPCPTAPPNAGNPSQPAANDPPPESATHIVGATAKQETVLREILAGLAPTIIDEVRIAPARPPWTPFKPHSVIVSVHYSHSPEKERGEWEAALLSEAFATRSRLADLQPVAGYETSKESLALDGPEEPKPDTRKPIDQSELIEALSTAARSSGAEILSVRAVKPMNPAVALTLRVEAPAFFLKHRLDKLMRSVPGSDRRYDGLYIRIVDREDRFVWISATTDGESISGGTTGARKDLEGCYPSPLYGSADGREPPPCPVD